MSEYMNQIGRLSKRLAAAGDQIESQRLALEDLREENYRLERILQAPLSLKDLEVAWEAAEVADECREGDVLIIRDDEDNYVVRRMDDRSDLDSTARVLSRAPRREPWADLGDKLAVEMPGIEDEPRIEALAKALYCEHGVRVRGGGE